MSDLSYGLVQAAGCSVTSVKSVNGMVDAQT